MDADALLARIEHQRARLDEALSRVDDRWFTSTPAEGAWTAKDQLAHIAAWHRVALGRLTGFAPEDLRDVVRGEYTSDTIDEVNARFLDRDRDTPLADVSDEFERSYDEMLTAVAGMTEPELSRPWLPEDPGRGTFAQMVASNTFEHYEEHVPLLQALAAE